MFINHGIMLRRGGRQGATEQEQTTSNFEAHASELWFGAVTFDTSPTQNTNTIMYTGVLVKNADTNIF